MDGHVNQKSRKSVQWFAIDAATKVVWLTDNLYIYKILGCFCKREIITRTTNYGDTNDVQT